MEIGTGHFMRCLALADALKKNGSNIRFVSRRLPEYLQGKLTEKGHGFALLKTPQSDTTPDELSHASWLGISQAQDATDSLRELSGTPWDWLVVDHYALDWRWESRARESTKKFLVIDDLADRRHDCDVLLDQNLYAGMERRYSGKTPENCRMLLGPSFALLGSEFRKLHEQARPRTGPVTRILVFFGGIDAGNFTEKAIDILSGIAPAGLHVDVVIGAQHPSQERIKLACAHHGFVCHVQTEKMAELMAVADLAIGAGGSACWERCSLGLPALLVALADNQINIAKALDLFGACIYAGTSKATSDTVIRNAIISLISSPEKLMQISNKAYSLVDGLGAERVCREMGLK